MAGHSQFSNIKHRKEAQDSKKAKVFTKLRKEIIVSAKIGIPDAAFNPRLRAAISAARAKNMPKDRIDAAIKEASSPANTDNYDEMRYEGYAPGGFAIIVEALTDNRNRTASDVRAAFTKFGGSLGETGSVNFMFNHIGLIEFQKNVASEDEMLEAALEAGASDVETNDEMHHVICEIELFNEVREKLSAKFGEPENAHLSWQPQNMINVSGEQAQKLMKLIDILEDNDDVQHVFGNYYFE